ncbi:hypothetical protein CAS80_02210 [Acinetobacter baumannii]|uniref:hypothetical protein n=1 Tax=Acinetobacter baumannii TaxID=470 RepID=UPI000A3D324A|nr:hypothetical protein [Acinetobacter baumannii]OTT40965.1 hypothetical protein CAS80_02210 [Acinetobacter baumannii]HCG3356027.1 hypothetical protein [Acinetobacter baumannii]HDX5873767.1 hypothetical protein [Acinetobacter baumannii]
MVRPVLADEILFKECIFYLREDLYKKNQGFASEDNQQTYSCINTTFLITKPWIFEDFTIHPSKVSNFPIVRQSILNFVENPKWVQRFTLHPPQLFGEALSSIVSFITLRPVKSPRGDDLRVLKIKSIENIPEDILTRLSFTLTFISAGPGFINTYLGQEKEEKYISEIKTLLKILKELKESDYIFVLEVLRLIQLSILSKRDDLGEAYLLLISALEAVSQKVIKRKTKKHPKESIWEEKAENDELFKELLTEYKDIRGYNKYLGERFVDFILKYSPVSCWDEIIEDRDEYGFQIWHGDLRIQHPKDMSQEELRKILKNAYRYRSEFVHQGAQPPHSYNTSNSNKFFEASFSEDCPIDIRLHSGGPLISSEYVEISPKYEFMLGLAKHAILNWLNVKIKR